MRNKVKRTLSFLLTFVMLCSLLPAMALAKEPEGRYEEVAKVESLVKDAEVHVYSTKGAGDIELTGTNLVGTTFPQGSGYREYTATAKEGWVFKTWRYEQLHNGEDLENREDWWLGTRYSFTNSGDNWYDPYKEGNTTISVNHLKTDFEIAGTPIIYNIYADFNPTITATAGDNGTIFNGEKPVDAKEPVEVEYGKDQTFEIKANDGYVIDTIKVDGNVVEENVNKVSDTYTFENVAEPHNIDVTFRKTEVGECTVTYEVFGEFPADYVIPESVTVNEGDIYTVADVPPNVTTDEGTYTFKGWYNGEIKVGDTIEVTSDVTLTGTWTFDGKDDVWNAVYGSIRVYMDEGTKADFDNLPGFNLNKQVRLYSEKYLTDGYRLCGYEPINDFWYTTNAKDVTARDISEIVLAKDKLVGSSEKISIPMTGNDDYQVTVSEGKDKFGLIPYTYLKIEISKKEPVEGTVLLTYDVNGGTGAPASTTVNKNTEVTLDSTTTPTHAEADGKYVTFAGWSNEEAVKGMIYEKGSEPTPVDKVTVGETDVTVYAVWVYGDPVDPVDPPEPPTWDHSKDKTATELDNNYNSTVTLSLPSAEKELVSDVVFVLDKSSCKEDVTDNALKMLADLGTSVKNTGAKIKVGAVQFAGRAVVSCGLTELTEEAIAEGGVIEKGLTEPKISDGTNLQAGLLKAQKMLEADKDVEDSRKYVIVITDGLTRQFLAEDETLMAIYNGLDADGGRVWGSPSGWCTANGFEDGYFQIPGGNWDTYYAAVKANVAKDGNTYAHDYDVYGSTPAGENIPDSYVPQGKTSLQHALCLDRAIYEADKVYSELEAANYHCYAVFAPITPNVHNNDLGKAFVKHLNGGNDQDIDFNMIQKDIYYLLDAGSQVVDIIGQDNDYNFDVVNLDNMTITVGSEELNKVKIQPAEFPGRTTYGFFKGEIADGKYDFVVTYYPDGVADGETREHFVWSINVPVGNFAPVQFSYDVHLTDPQTTKGTYTVATNVEAVLTPVDSNGTKGKPEKFPVPELTYEVKGGGSGEDYRYVNVTVVGKGDVDYKCGDHKGTITEKDGTELLTLDLFENSMKFNMEPASGWKLDRIEVNGKDVGKDLEYKMIFDEVTGDQMDIDVKIVFKEKSDGGSGGGSHRPSNKPDKTPEALNGDDHFDYVVGYSDGLVHPERNITRAEVASIFFRLLQDDVREKNLTDQNPFNDVFTDDWFNVAVSTMYDMDIVYGRDNNNFDPNAYITRAEFAAIAARFDSEGYSGENLFTDIDGHWAANQINRAAEKGWISGYPDGTFGPDRYITRAEAVTMINRVLNRLPESADALHEDMNVFPDNMDTTAWYYLAIQEATSSHEYEKDKDGVYETWTDVLPDRDWAQYLKLN